MVYHRRWAARAAVRGILSLLLVLLPVQYVTANRVLSETIVGDAVVPPSPTESTDPSRFSEPKSPTLPEAKPPTLPKPTPPSSLELNNLPENAIPKVDTEPPVPLSVWFTSGETVYRSSPASTDTTDLVFDPVGSSFSLSGREIGMGLSFQVAGVRAGLSMREGGAGGSVRAKIKNPNLRYINTDLSLSHSSVGIFLEDSFNNDRGGSTSRVAVEGSRHRLIVSNDYRHGLFFGVPSVTRSYRSTDLVLDLGHDYTGRSGLGVFLNQSYRVPLGDGFGVTGSAISVGVRKELGPGPTAILDHHRGSVSCGGLEVFGSGGVSSLSGTSSEVNIERSTAYAVDSALGWDASTLGGRYRFDADKGCALVWGGLARKRLAYGTGYIEQLQPAVYTDPFESSGTLTLEGIEFGLGRQHDLNVDSGRRGYVFGGVSTFVGSGDVTAVSRFGSNVETTGTGTDATLLGIRLGTGYEIPLRGDRYLFYEMSVGRYDARPFGTDLRGIEVGLDLGLGL